MRESGKGYRRKLKYLPVAVVMDKGEAWIAYLEKDGGRWRDFWGEIIQI